MYDDILVFVNLVKRGGFTEVARHLNINQSTVSRKIQQLEERLALRLVKRNVRNFELTLHGRKLYELFKDYEQQVSQLLGLINKEAKTLSGKLNIALPITFSRYAISPHLDKFTEANPRLRIKLQFHHNEVNMLKEDYDIVITSHVPRQQTQKLRIIHKIKIILCCTPEYIEKYGNPDDLLSTTQHNFLCQIGNENFNELTVYSEDNNQKVSDLKIKSNIFLSNYMHAKIIARNGKYITAMPEEYIRDELRAGKLIRVLPEYYFGYISFYLLKNIEDSDARFVRFKEFIDDCMRNIDHQLIVI